LCNEKCNQNYILKPCIQDPNYNPNVHALIPTLALSPSFQFVIACWKGKVSLMKKSYANMCMAIFKCVANLFLNLEFIKYRNVFSSSKLPMALTMANSTSLMNSKR
jgi:hypothetical protein